MSVSSAAGSAAKPPYDPVRAFEGMFNGSLLRIGAALRDPRNFGASTNTILAETTKRFQDALDDVEIQILDAKWYLEHKLSAQRAAREAKAAADAAAAVAATAAATEGASVKRKRNSQDNNEEEAGTPAKRMKTEAPKIDTVPSQIATESESTTTTAKEADSTSPTQPTTAVPSTTPAVFAGSGVLEADASKPVSAQTHNQRTTPTTQSITTDKPSVRPQVATMGVTIPQPASLKSEQQPQLSSVSIHNDGDNGENYDNGNNNDNNNDNEFESMFGIPMSDAQDNAAGNMNSETDDLFNQSFDVQDTKQNDSSLLALPPEPANPINQTKIEFSSDRGDKDVTDSKANISADNTGGFGNDFDLPDLGGPNMFDDLLNDDTFAIDDNFDSQHFNVDGNNSFDDLFGND